MCMLQYCTFTGPRCRFAEQEQSTLAVDKYLISTVPPLGSQHSARWSGSGVCRAVVVRALANMITH